MKTVLIVEHEINELEALMNICRHDSSEMSVLTARDEASARSILDNKHIDLTICSTRFPESQDCQAIAALARTFPYIPLIAVAPADTVEQDQILALGANALIEKPFSDEDLLVQVRELSEHTSSGTIRGIPLHSFLQMLESEGKTCTLHVFGPRDTGLVYIKNGTPINAETGSLTGEEAVYELISWPNVIIDIRFFNGFREEEITKPLISLIMEGFRLKDERESRKRQEQTIVEPRKQLRQVSTDGLRLALDIGLRLKVEFESIDASLDSSLAGLVTESCIIIVTPSHFIVTKTPIEAGTYVIVKYMYMGKLCLFKSRILKTVEAPIPLLILDYPAVIHFHEMRKAKRTAIFIPCTLNLADGGRYFGAFKELSSAGGLCQFKTEGGREIPDVNINQQVEVSCLLPGILDEQKIDGVVRNYKRNEGEIQIGIEFIELPSEIKKTVERYLHSVQPDSDALADIEDLITSSPKSSDN